MKKKKGEKMKEQFCGVWSHSREEYLKSENPTMYKMLIETGELEEYLNGYQEAYSRKASSLTQKLEAENGVNEELYKTDALEWILESEKIQEVVKETLEKEIWQ